MSEGDDVDQLLDVVVAGIGGEPRDGQRRMARWVAASLSDRTHALLQAGTGTGKSVAYLVPALAHVRDGGGPVVVATATLALQHQLVSRDLPAIERALADAGAGDIAFAVLKGRANYLCRQRLNDPIEDPDQLAFDGGGLAARGRLEDDAARVRDWAEHTETGERDELDDIDPRVWRAFSVSARECVGAAKCPFGQECFAELARDRAAEADIVVTNHALLALHALEAVPVLPEHDAVIVDEAHELADRATSAITVELSAPMVTRAVGGARRQLDGDTVDAIESAATALADALFGLEGQVPVLPEELRAALALVRDGTHAAMGELGAGGQSDPDAIARLQRARSALEDVHDVAGDLLAAGDEMVVWVDRLGAGRQPVLRAAPLSVAGPLRTGLFDKSTVVLTSATLALGGDFAHVARGLGLRDDERDVAGSGSWTSDDVGSPFDFAAQGILYVAADLPRPGRDGPSLRALDELAALVNAAGGRTLALYSSWRGVEAAAERLEDIDVPLLVQRRGDSVGALVRRFAAEPTSVLVGTLSLWQGVDVPGEACILVVIDRIPFPRPDEPLVAARTRRAEENGGNGFTAVSVPKASLLMAQGAGRLIRSGADRGVVAVLDPRLHTAGYGAFIRRSMPPLWATTDRVQVVGALERLAATFDAADRSGG